MSSGPLTGDATANDDEQPAANGDDATTGPTTQSLTRRRCCSLLGTGAAVGLAGCSVLGGDGGGGSDVGEVGTVDPEQLAVVDTKKGSMANSGFKALVTIANEGEETADIKNYQFTVEFRDDEGNTLDTATWLGSGSGEIKPGTDREFDMTSYSIQESAVATYVVSITCGGMTSSQAVYC